MRAILPRAALVATLSICALVAWPQSSAVASTGHGVVSRSIVSRGPAVHFRHQLIAMSEIVQWASDLAGEPVSINCTTKLEPGVWGQTYSTTEDDGVTLDFLAEIDLRLDLCGALRHATTFEWIDTTTAEAMLSLTHEAMHIRLRSGCESLVEATALANRWQLVKRFKLGALEARFVMDQEVHVDQTMLTPIYHQPC